MMCYECSRQGNQRPAVGMCHNCSIGLCAEHGVRVKTVVGHSTGRSFAAKVGDRELPEEAQRFLCGDCSSAAAQHHLAQTHLAKTA